MLLYRSFPTHVVSVSALWSGVPSLSRIEHANGQSLVVGRGILE